MLLWSAFGGAGDLVAVFLLLSLGSLVLYFGLAGASSYLSYRRFHRASVPQSKERQQAHQAIGLSVISVFGNAALTSPVLVLILQGASRVYFHVADYGWAYLVFTIAALLLFTETLVYWIHRALHLRALYNWIHRYHHAFRTPTPWVSLAFHPLDSFAQAVPYHLFAFLFPVHIGVYAAALFLVTLWTFAIHEPVSFFPNSWLNFASHHELHHTCNKYNYGQFFTLWDRIGNTYRHPPTEVASAQLR
jgi:lathosterol oxidase